MALVGACLGGHGEDVAERLRGLLAEVVGEDGASGLVEPRCGGRTTPLAVVLDHDGPASTRRRCCHSCRGSRVGPLADVAAPLPGEEIAIHLRYLVNSRLLTAGELATLRTVSGADPRRVIKEDEHD